MINRALLKKDGKMVFRDPMIILILFIPFLMSGVFQLLLKFDPFRYLPFKVNRELVILVLRAVQPLFGGFMAGTITGFIILEEKESGVIPQLRVSPLTKVDLLNTRLFVTFILGIIITSLLSLGDRILFGPLTGGFIIFLLCSSIGPFIMIIMAGFGKNRVHGLTLAKLSSLIFVPPILGMFLTGIPRWLFILLSPLTCFFYAVTGILTGELSTIRGWLLSVLGSFLISLYTLVLVYKTID